MNKNDEVIFNLFIMAFKYPNFHPHIDQDFYEEILKNSEFNIFKDCFPENEFCHNYEVLRLIDSQNTYKERWKRATYNYIREV